MHGGESRMGMKTTYDTTSADFVIDSPLKEKLYL